jgi:signal peptidase I
MAEEAQMEQNRPAPRQELPAGRVKKPPLAQELYQYASSMLAVLVGLILIFTFVARLSVVKGASMEPTLTEGDVLLVRTLFYTPRPGDVVVLTKESFGTESIVKRVIAVGGQQVRVDYGAGKVFVDGVALEEEGIWGVFPGPCYPEELLEVTVPEGCLYVLGDNRMVSLDSRYPAIGLVDERCVIGQGVMVLFPFSDLGML